MDQKPPQIRHTMMSATRVAPARPVGRAAPVPAARAAEARTFSLTRETAVSYLWAVVRLGMAWTFLWPFFDKDVRTRSSKHVGAGLDQWRQSNQGIPQRVGRRVLQLLPEHRRARAW